MEAVESMRLGACKFAKVIWIHTCSPIFLRYDFGIRCIIAPSFAEIFRNNTFQNGLLPIALPKDVCRELGLEAEAGLELEIDLNKQEIRRASGKAAITFDVDLFRRDCLLKGLDDISLTLHKSIEIEAFEMQRSELWPWLDGFGYEKRKIPIESDSREKTESRLDW